MRRKWRHRFQSLGATASCNCISCACLFISAEELIDPVALRAPQRYRVLGISLVQRNHAERPQALEPASTDTLPDEVVPKPVCTLNGSDCKLQDLAEYTIRATECEPRELPVWPFCSPAEPSPRATNVTVKHRLPGQKTLEAANFAKPH
jgi:hypothetical protein